MTIQRCAVTSCDITSLTTCYVTLHLVQHVMHVLEAARPDVQEADGLHERRIDIDDVAVSQEFELGVPARYHL